jgi:hypothetical protein
MKSWRAFLLLLLPVWGAAGLFAKPVDALRSSRGYDGLGSVRYLRIWQLRWQMPL